MTTIVGIRKASTVWIGSDKLLSSHSARLGNLTKTIIVNEDTANVTCIGVAGSSTAILALEDILSEHEHNCWATSLDIYRNMLNIHTILRDHHALRVYEQEDDAFESSQFQAIIGNRHGLWTMLSGREIIPAQTYCAVGSGREFALGSMESLGTLDPEATIKNALSIAHKYDKSTGKEVELWSNVTNLT